MGVGMNVYQVPSGTDPDRGAAQAAAIRQWDLGHVYLAVEAIGERLPDGGDDLELIGSFSGLEDVVMVSPDEARRIVGEIDRLGSDDFESADDATQIAALRAILVDIGRSSHALAVVTD